MIKTFFQWDNELKTGFNDIDNQHQGLIEVINEVIQLCLSNEKLSEHGIENIYVKLIKYVEEHFSSEEDLMNKMGIALKHKDEHIRAHLEFKENVKQYFSDLISLQTTENLSTVAEYLIRWLAYHILNMDKSLVRQINYIINDNQLAEDAFKKEQNIVETSSEPLLKALKALFYVVSEKNKELERLNSELEEKVRIRTDELHQSYEKLVLVSIKDELTGLFNRRHAINEINQSIGNFKRYGVAFSILFIDIDKFKTVNDKYGHEYGDQVLKSISEYLKSQTRQTDITCRIGGDEFLIICNYCLAEDAMHLAQKLNNEIKKHIQEEIMRYWEPSISIGVAEIDDTCLSVREVLNKADGAMYVAKNNGGNSARLAAKI
jgi:hemerythrin